MGVVIQFPANRAWTSKRMPDMSVSVPMYPTSFKQAVDAKTKIYRIEYRMFWTPAVENGRWAGIPVREHTQFVHLNAKSEDDARELFMETHGQGTEQEARVVRITAM